ncbi:MAG TPA: amidohydrolase family protein, partial [Burkholderiales bacterium]|nr:amidohydrolase family protein [Burkholderiales bacterium]
FGSDHVLFGTDCPFDPEGGPLFIREIMKAMEQLKLKPNDRRKIYFGNAANLLKLSLPKPAAPAKKKPAKKAKKKR